MKVQKFFRLSARNAPDVLPFVIEQTRQQGIDRFLDERLGKRSDEAEYGNDGILAVVYSHFCVAFSSSETAFIVSLLYFS